MGNGVLSVRMLGNFVISFGQGEIDDTQNRSKKVWALLAVLLCNHGRVVKQKELLDLLWRDDGERENPAASLKTTLHRARTMLAAVDPVLGPELILNKNGGYTYNSKIPLWLDFEEFERLCAVTPGSKEELSALTQALSLYQGAFLHKFSSELWVIPKATYYHNLYVRTVGRALELLETTGRLAEAEVLCRGALRQDPCRESLYQHLMRTLIAMGKGPQAAGVYEEMEKLLLSNFGVMPDGESRKLYRDALRTVNTHTVPPGVILEQLREKDVITGALVCDYDFFKMIYQAEARMVARSGSAVHILLLTLRGYRSKVLSARSLELAMDNMEEILRTNLRKGDVVTRCSVSQFLVMLPRADFENSNMVCERILRAFSRKYPHSPAAVDQALYPIEPVGL